MNRRTLEKRLDRLEDETGEQPLEEFPSILMQNLREQYGYD
ncbi:hypothetical protein [Natronococcus occultus]|nr:hypothetical protein [Natronococcus occultus]